MDDQIETEYGVRHAESLVHVPSIHEEINDPAFGGSLPKDIKYLQVLPWNHDAIGFQVYRQSKDIPLPVFATKDSAAFDLCFSSQGKKTFTAYHPDEPKPLERNFEHDGGIFIRPRERVMV